MSGRHAHKHRVVTGTGMRELYSFHSAPTYSLEEETFDILRTVLNFATTFKPPFKKWQRAATLRGCGLLKQQCAAHVDAFLQRAATINIIQRYDSR